MNGDFRLADGRTADFRSQTPPSPCSDIDTVGTGPSSPISVSTERAVDAQLVQDSLQHHQQLAGAGAGAGCAPRTATSSFLIKDILGDSKPLAACAPYSTSVPSPKAESAAAPDGFRPKLEQEESRSKLDPREDMHGDMKCNGKSVRVRGARLSRASSQNKVKKKSKRSRIYSKTLTAETEMRSLF